MDEQEEDAADVEDEEAPGPDLWVRTFGGELNDYAMNVEIDSSGDILLAGYFASAFDFLGTPIESAGAHDLVVAKLDRRGDLVWVRTVGGAGMEMEPHLAVDEAGNVLLAGEFGETFELSGILLENQGSADMLLVMLSPGGDVLWAKGFGGPGQEIAPKVGFDGEGRVILSGAFEGTVDFGGGDRTASDTRDIVVARLSATDGSHDWSLVFGGGADDIVQGMAVGPAGEAGLTGWFGNSIDFGGDPFTEGGGFVAVLAGADGGHVWSRALSNGENDSGCGIAFHPSGDLVVSGWFQGVLDFGGGPRTSVDHSDAFAARYGAAGEHVWSRAFGGPSVDSSCAVAVMPGGDALVGGFFNSEIDFGSGPIASAGPCDGWLARLAGADGGHVRSYAVGGASADYVQDVAVGPYGFAVVAGDFNETADVIGITVSSAGGSDGFVAWLPAALLAPDGP